MTSRHRLLVVEDEDFMRQDLEAIVRDLGFEVESCADKQTALELLNERHFCMALVDLQILRTPKPNSITPNYTHGISLVREIRMTYPTRHHLHHRFPIVVVSGYAREGPAARDVMDEGASYIVWKDGDVALATHLSKVIKERLLLAGKEDHADCSPTPLELSIPGKRKAKRTAVMLGARTAYLADRHLCTLLFLVRGKVLGSRVSNLDMGASGPNRRPSEINKEMADAFPSGVKQIIKNDHHGNYWLIDDITIGSIAYEELRALENHSITALANELQGHLPCDGNS